MINQAMFLFSLLQECECNGSIIYDALSDKNIGECWTDEDGIDWNDSKTNNWGFCFVNPQANCHDKKHWKNGAFISTYACQHTSPPF
jgi:hypothetical protein